MSIKKMFFVVLILMSLTPAGIYAQQQREPTSGYEPCMDWWRGSLTRSLASRDQNNNAISSKQSSISRLESRLSGQRSNQRLAETSVSVARLQLKGSMDIAKIEQGALDTVLKFIETQQATLQTLAQSNPEVYATLLRSIELSDETIEAEITVLQRMLNEVTDEAKKAELNLKINSLSESRIIRSTLHDPAVRKRLIEEFFSKKSDELLVHVSEPFVITLELVRTKVLMNNARMEMTEKLIAELKTQEAERRASLETAKKMESAHLAQVRAAETASLQIAQEISSTQSSIRSEHAGIASLQESNRFVQADIDTADRWLNGECFNQNSRPVPRDRGGPGGK